MLAKLTAGLKKPNGLTIIRREDVPGLLENLPVGEIAGIGKKTAAHLAGYGIITCGQLAKFPVNVLTDRFGVIGEHLHRMANGQDESPVIPIEEAEDSKSVGHSTTLDHDISDREEIQHHILRLSEMVGRRARRYQYAGHTVTLTLRYTDFSTFSKQHSIREYINHGSDIYLVANHILEGIRLQQAIRLVGVTLSGLARDQLQLDLFEFRQKKTKAVEAMDKINNRYGEFSITYGRLMHCHKHSRIISPSYKPDGLHRVNVL